MRRLDYIYEGDGPFVEELETFFTHGSRRPKFAIGGDWLLPYETLADGKLYRADPVISETRERDHGVRCSRFGQRSAELLGSWKLRVSLE